MNDDPWFPLVLKELEYLCHEKSLPEVAFYIEEARQKFKLSQSKELTLALSDCEYAEPIKLVWSQPINQLKSSKVRD